jgi:hypothetical protein
MLKERSGYWLFNGVLYIVGGDFSYDDFRCNSPSLEFSGYCFLSWRKHRNSHFVRKNIFARGLHVSCFLPLL